MDNTDGGFYAKFRKPRDWRSLLGDTLDIQPVVSPSGSASGGKKAALPQQKKDGGDVSLDTPKDTEEGYSFNITPEEYTAPAPIQQPQAKQGILGYFKQKGQQAYDNMIHPALTDLVKKFEGFRSSAYLPTKNDVPTIGYGITGPDVKLGDTITKEQADAMLQQRLQETQDKVKSMVKVPLTDNQLNSLTSLVYNVGEHAFRKSKALTALNAGDFDTFQKEAFDPQHGFVHQDGEILTGLVNRRQREKELFNT